MPPNALEHQHWKRLIKGRQNRKYCVMELISLLCRKQFVFCLFQGNYRLSVVLWMLWDLLNIHYKDILHSERPSQRRVFLHIEDILFLISLSYSDVSLIVHRLLYKVPLLCQFIKVGNIISVYHINTEKSIKCSEHFLK